MSEPHLIPDPFAPADGRDAGRQACEQLEAGGILYFPTVPFSFGEEDREFLLSVRQSKLANHKNIAYRPRQDRITGYEGEAEVAARLHDIMRAFSQAASGFLESLLQPYAGRWWKDYASFRPLQEEGRQIRQSARNDLMHLDNFPTRPTKGARILRVFVNINPEEPRRWITGAPIHELVDDPRQREAMTAVARKVLSPLTLARLKVAQLAGAMKLPVHGRPPYDEIMIRYHHHLKADGEYQAQGARNRWQFPPGSCWMVYTDSVPHAVLAGQYAIEQTYMVDPAAMLDREKCPLGVLEKLTGRPLLGG